MILLTIVKWSTISRQLQELVIDNQDFFSKYLCDFFLHFIFFMFLGITTLKMLLCLFDFYILQ